MMTFLVGALKMTPRSSIDQGQSPGFSLCPARSRLTLTPPVRTCTVKKVLDPIWFAMHDCSSRSSDTRSNCDDPANVYSSDACMVDGTMTRFKAIFEGSFFLGGRTLHPSDSSYSRVEPDVRPFLGGGVTSAEFWGTEAQWSPLRVSPSSLRFGRTLLPAKLQSAKWRPSDQDLIPSRSDSHNGFRSKRMQSADMTRSSIVPGATKAGLSLLGGWRIWKHLSHCWEHWAFQGIGEIIGLGRYYKMFLDFLVGCLEKVPKKYSSKWWFDGDLSC